ncbi:hypothetical protein GXW82_31525 [Streptacidiphilus sp. 4-A2]|nr:hypothetical protein [Streptacidiphilus sp. 4-A2]
MRKPIALSAAGLVLAAGAVAALAWPQHATSAATDPAASHAANRAASPAAPQAPQHRADAAAAQRWIAARLPAGWSDTAATDGRTITVQLVFAGDVDQVFHSLMKSEVLDPRSPRMLTLLQGAAAEGGYVFDYTDTHGDGLLVKVQSLPGTGALHLDLVSAKYLQAQIDGSAH